MHVNVINRRHFHVAPGNNVCTGLDDSFGLRVAKPFTPDKITLAIVLISRHHGGRPYSL